MEKKVAEKEFISTIKQNEAIIYRISSFYANKSQSIADLYQEIVLNLWQAYPSFRGDSKISTWIYRISLNTCISFLRSTKSRPILLNEEITFDVPEDADRTEDIEELYRLIEKLSEIEKALILLYLEEKSYREIAEITGISVTNVATKLSRIKEKLKNMLNVEKQ